MFIPACLHTCRAPLGEERKKLVTSDGLWGSKIGNWETGREGNRLGFVWFSNFFSWLEREIERFVVPHIYTCIG